MSEGVTLAWLLPFCPVRKACGCKKAQAGEGALVQGGQVAGKATGRIANRIDSFNLPLHRF